MREFDSILRGLDLMRAERARLSMRGPRFIVLHRFWQPETLCTPGEAIADVRLVHRRQWHSLALSTRPLLFFDYLARHMRLPQSASQIVAGMSVDPFCQEHGTYAGLSENLNKSLSRNAVKQQIVRLRAALRSVFREAALNINPDRVLIAQEIAGNEVRYALRARIEWQHIEH